MSRWFSSEKVALSAAGWTHGVGQHSVQTLKGRPMPAPGAKCMCWAECMHYSKQQGAQAEAARAASDMHSCALSQAFKVVANDAEPPLRAQL